MSINGSESAGTPLKNEDHFGVNDGIINNGLSGALTRLGGRKKARQGRTGTHTHTMGNSELISINNNNKEKKLLGHNSSKEELHNLVVVAPWLLASFLCFSTGICPFHVSGPFNYSVHKHNKVTKGKERKGRGPGLSLSLSVKLCIDLAWWWQKGPRMKRRVLMAKLLLT